MHAKSRITCFAKPTCFFCWYGIMNFWCWEAWSMISQHPGTYPYPRLDATLEPQTGDNPSSSIEQPATLAVIFGLGIKTNTLIKSSTVGCEFTFSFWNSVTFLKKSSNYYITESHGIAEFPWDPIFSLEKYGCFLKWLYPQNTPKWSFWETPHIWRNQKTTPVITSEKPIEAQYYHGVHRIRASGGAAEDGGRWGGGILLGFSKRCFRVYYMYIYIYVYIYKYLVIQSDLFGMVKWPF